MWKLRQLQAQLSAAHTRVAELEAQAAQDQSLVVEASFCYFIRELGLFCLLLGSSNVVRSSCSSQALDGHQL